MLFLTWEPALSSMLAICKFLLKEVEIILWVFFLFFIVKAIKVELGELTGSTHSPQVCIV